MPIVQTHEGGEIYYEVRGNGPVNLLFLHGMGGAGEVWNEVVRPLDAGRFRVICLDLRGCGRSACPKNGYTFDSYNRDILAVANQEEAHRFIPIGFCSGGKLACYVASENPERTTAQVLIAPPGPGTVPISREAGFKFCEEASDWKKVKAFYRSWFASSASEAVVDAACQTISQTPRFVLEAILEMSLWTSLAPLFGSLTLPTLVVTGESDPIYHAGYQQAQMLPFLSEPSIVTLAAGHFIPLECPAELAESISRFLTKVGA